MLDLVSDGFAVLCRFFGAIKRSPRDGDDRVQLTFQRCRRWWWLLLLRFQKQFRLSENTLAHRAFGVTPCVIERGGLARGPVLLGESLRHPHALFGIDSRHRSQIAHSDLRGDLALAYLLLDGLGQRVHQRQTAPHPRGAAVETPGQFLD